MQLDGFISALSSVLYGDIALSINTQYNTIEYKIHEDLPVPDHSCHGTFTCGWTGGTKYCIILCTCGVNIKILKPCHFCGNDLLVVLILKQ